MLRISIIAVALSGVYFSVQYFDMLDGTPLQEEILQATQLEWHDLVPPAEPLADVLSDTPMNVRFDLGYIGKVMADANAHVITRDGPEYRNAMELLEKSTSTGY